MTAIFSPVALRINSSVGQPLTICQTMCGRNSSAASPPAHHGQKPREQPEPEPQHADLVLQTEAEKAPQEQPETRVGPLEDADQEVRRSGPEQKIERVHGVEMIERQVHGRHEDRDHGENLGETSAAELARHQPGQQDGRGPRHGRDEPDGGQRIAENRPRDAQHQK
jgi:hypothetical protein